MTHPYYAESLWRREVWRARLAECRHVGRDYETDFGPDGATIAYCRQCADAANPLERAYREAYKAARKRKLADEPRCDVEGCKRRGTWRFPYHVLVCGAHKRHVLAAHSRAAAGLGGLAIAIPTYGSKADLLAFAAKGGAR